MELLVLDQNLKSIEILDIFNSLIWTDRYCGYGDFEITMPVNDAPLSILNTDYFLNMSESDRTMIIETKQIKSDVEDGNYLIVSGRSLESILYRRIVWGQTILTGNFQNGIKKLITDSFINPSIAARKVNKFRFVDSTDPVITALTIDEQFNGEYVYDVVASLCAAKKIGFKLTLAADNYLEFSLFSGKDRSYNQTLNPYVIFSPTFENLFNSNYLESTNPFKSASLVGGEGEGSARKMIAVEIDSPPTGLSRREMFTDASDISSTTDSGTLTTEQYNAQLTQRGKQDLAYNTLIRSFEGEVDYNQSFKYGEDFFLGDIVQLANEYGIESRSRVSEIVFSQDPSGISSYPTFDNV